MATRCKKGFRRVPAKTGNCIPKTARKRCPNGTKKNKKTGNCDPKKSKGTTLRKRNSSSLTAKSLSSPSLQGILSTEEIKDLIDYYLDDIQSWMSKSEKEEFRNDKPSIQRIIRNAKLLQLDNDELLEYLDKDDHGGLLSELSKQEIQRRNKKNEGRSLTTE